MKELQLSGIDLTFPLLEFRKSLKLIKLLGFDRADIALNGEEDGRHLSTAKELEAPYENGRRLGEVLAEEGLEQTDLFVFMGDMLGMAQNHPDREIRKKNREMFGKAMEYGRGCGCRHMTILPGMPFDKESMELAAEELKYRIALAEEKGLTLSVEAHVGSVADTPGKARKLLAMVPGLTLTLDYSHFIRNGAEQREIDDLIPFASHMHFRNASRQCTQTIFQESEIDYVRVLERMRETGFDGAAAIEFCHNQWEGQNRVDTVSETIFLKEYMEENWRKMLETERRDWG